MPNHEVGRDRHSDLDGLLVRSMAEGIRWDGSPDLMWQRIRSRLAPRPAWRKSPAAVVMAAMGLAAIGLAAALWVVVASRQTSLPGGQPRGDLIETTTLPALMAYPRKIQVAPGETLDVDFTVGAAEPHAPAGTITNLAGEATLRVIIRSLEPGPASQPGHLIFEESVGVYHLIGRNYKNRSVSMAAPTQPGWYILGLQLEIPEEDKTVSLRSHDTPLFVNYPEGAVRQEVIVVERTVTRSGSILTVHQVSMTPSETQIAYSLSNVRPETAFQLDLVRDGTGDSVLLRRHESIFPDRIAGVAVFGPTTVAISSMSFEVAELPKDGSGSTPDQGLLAMEIVLKPK